MAKIAVGNMTNKRRLRRATPCLEIPVLYVKLFVINNADLGL